MHYFSHADLNLPSANPTLIDPLSHMVKYAETSLNIYCFIFQILIQYSHAESSFLWECRQTAPYCLKRPITLGCFKKIDCIQKFFLEKFCDLLTCKVAYLLYKCEGILKIK